MRSTDDPAATPRHHDGINRRLVDDGFVFVPAMNLRACLPAAAGGGSADFAASWGRLGEDRYMADGGRYRRRRHAAFAVGPDGIVRKAHQSHYQSRDYNPLNGGIERWFEPIEPGIAAGPTLQAILGFAADVFTPLSRRGGSDWHVEVHQFRIEAAAGQVGLPTPEGLHRDGVDWVLVMLVARVNVAEGVTRIHEPGGREVGAFCLAEPFDAALVDDHRLLHAVTPITPVDDRRPGWRDVLVVTFKAA